MPRALLRTSLPVDYNEVVDATIMVQRAKETAVYRQHFHVEGAATFFGGVLWGGGGGRGCRYCTEPASRQHDCLLSAFCGLLFSAHDGHDSGL